MEPVSIAIIGGTGLYQFDGIEILEVVEVETPFGAPSAPITIANLDGRRVAFLPRHGEGHCLNPTRVPYRANIWALKSLGVFWCISVSAVGSLKKSIEPEHFVIPDQLIDRTRHRVGTFFDDIAVHAGFADPFNPELRELLLESCRGEGVTVHDGGTYVCMEGPVFSTRAESAMHRGWGASIIGMTALPEAKLAREAEMAYATIALATDYDVWFEEEVTVGAVVEHLRNNVSNVQRVLRRLLPTLPLGEEERNSAYRALEGAILTQPDRIPASAWETTGLLLEKYLDRPTGR